MLTAFDQLFYRERVYYVSLSVFPLQIPTKPPIYFGIFVKQKRPFLSTTFQPRSQHNKHAKTAKKQPSAPRCLTDRQTDYLAVTEAVR